MRTTTKKDEMVGEQKEQQRGEINKREVQIQEWTFRRRRANGGHREERVGTVTDTKGVVLEELKEQRFLRILPSFSQISSEKQSEKTLVNTMETHTKKNKIFEKSECNSQSIAIQIKAYTHTHTDNIKHKYKHTHSSWKLVHSIQNMCYKKERKKKNE